MSVVVKQIDEIVREHPFFGGLEERYAELVSGCARNAHFQPGEYLFHEGYSADQFHLIRQGRVAMEVKAPGRGALTVSTLRDGEIVGVSWLIPPYRWGDDARAMEFTRTIAIDAACLRDKCEADHDLGYEMMKRFMPILLQRLHATQLQMLDVYGEPS